MISRLSVVLNANVTSLHSKSKSYVSIEVMLVLFITGLLLRLTSVQGGPSLSSLYQPEVPNRHLNLAPIDQRLSNDVTQPFDGISPRFWFGQGYRQAYKQMLQMYNDQLLTEKGTDSSSRVTKNRISLLLAMF